MTPIRKRRRLHSHLIDCRCLLYLRQFHAGEEKCYGQHGNAHDRVGESDAVAFSGEQESADNDRRQNASQSVERLRQIEAAGTCGGVAEFGGVGVGGCLEHHQSAAYHKQRSEKYGERHEMLARNEDKGSESEQKQAHHYSESVAAACDYDAGRKSHQEISQIGSGLD